MPIYEYECKKCGHGFSLTLAKKVRCPKCKSQDAKHIIASVFVTTSKKS